MSSENNFNKKRDIISILVLIITFVIIVIFNYIVDPYHVLRNSSIIGFNNKKIHEYTNKRTNIYSDIKINRKNKTTVFTGNCLLSKNGIKNNEIAFFTLPIVELNEIYTLIKNIKTLMPNLKTIYLGIFFDDFWNDENNIDKDVLENVCSEKYELKDFINILFSWNTTKYSIETVFASIREKDNNITYIYPYREIAKKDYNKSFKIKDIKYIKNIIDYANENNIELIIYYSPVHITKKIHIYKKNQWENNLKLKKELAKITQFYDYSNLNIYNTEIMDKNCKYYIDNIHISEQYNNLIVNDLLNEEKEIGFLVNNENIENHLNKETKELINYMKQNQNLTDKIGTITPKEYSIKIRKNNAN